MLEMKIIHIHANNSAGLVGKEKTPVVVEITYGSLHNLNKVSILPIELDEPCDPKQKEIKIEFIKDSDYFEQADRHCN
jgi:hypothetical protein